MHGVKGEEKRRLHFCVVMLPTLQQLHLHRLKKKVYSLSTLISSDIEKHENKG